MHVTAKDKTSGKEQKITIQNSTNLSEEEVEKMKQDAEKHADEDKRKKELVEARNHANSVAFEIRKQLTEHGSKLPAEDSKKIEEDVKKLEELAAKDDATKEQLDTAVQEVYQSAQKIGEAMRKASEANPTEKPAEDASADKKGDDKKDEGPVEEGEVVN